MPAPGDQHKTAGSVTANPFEETPTRMTEYTAQEIATLQSRLNKRLGPEYISSRPGPGGQKIAYLSADKAINLANEVFGFNGWSSSVQQIQIDFVDEHPQSGKISLGLSVIVRVTLKDGTYHEDIGYGQVDNCKGKAMAFEKCKKEGTTDALKRVLRNFGNVLGNCMYDKDYITKITKIKPGPGTKFDINNLHRHADFAPKQEEEEDSKSAVRISHPSHDSAATSLTTDFDDSFDMGEFDDVDFDDSAMNRPDEILLPPEPPAADPNKLRYETGNMKTPSKPPQIRPHMQQATSTGQVPAISRVAMTAPNAGALAGPAQAVLPSNLPAGAQAIGPNSNQNNSSSPGGISQNTAQPTAMPLPAQPPPQGNRPAGFYSAKVAQNLDPNNLSVAPPPAAKFNPHAESPSIRKTAGVDHNKSVPVRRDTLRAEASVPAPEVVDVRGDSGRRIGMPGQQMPTSTRPGLSTSAYRPPTRHGGSPAINTAVSVNGANPSHAAERAQSSAKRPPLGDVSNMQHSINNAAGEGIDTKRQRLSGPGDGGGGGVVHGSDLPRA